MAVNMKELDVLKDILQHKISNQQQYNRSSIEIRNPEIRNILKELRDDEMRSIANLQQSIFKIETHPSIISRIFPTKSYS